MRFAFTAILSALVFSSWGCSGGASDLPELAEVTGTVTLDNQPLAGATVEFIPTAGGRSSTATTNEQGNYELTYNADNFGAIVGSHQVKIVLGEGAAVEYPEGVNPDELSEAEQLKYANNQKTLPPKYNQKTELTAEVDAGNNTHDFNLTSE